MVEAKNFVEKELGTSIDAPKVPEPTAIPEPTKEKKEKEPTYIPPQQPVQNFVPPEINIFQQQPATTQIIEKIVYKKQRIHGFFRTLTILALLVIGFLMLGESLGIIQLSINNFPLHTIFPIAIIFSTIIIRSYRGLFGKIFGLILFLTVFGGIFTIGIYTSLTPTSKGNIQETIEYTPTTDTSISLETLIGTTYIEENTTTNTIKNIRNSDRNINIYSGKNSTGEFLSMTEEKNRNILQRYLSNIDMEIPKTTTISSLYIKNFLGLHTIDFTNLQGKNLKFHGGINDITIKANNTTDANIEIQGAVANVTIDVPEDVGVKMYYKHSIGILKLPSFDTLSGHYFQSQNYAKAQKHIEMYIKLGIGNTKINRIPKNK